MICTYLVSRGLTLCCCCLGSFELSRTQARLVFISTLVLFSSKGKLYSFSDFQRKLFLINVFLSGSQYKASVQTLESVCTCLSYASQSAHGSLQHQYVLEFLLVFSVAFGVILVLSFTPGLPTERKAA